MVKIYAVLLLLLLSSGVELKGQTFSLTSRLGHLSAQYNSMLLESGRIFCTGVIQDTTSPYLTFNVFASYDTTGQLNYYKVFKGDSSIQEVGTFENALIKTNSGGFAVCGYTISSGKINCLFIKYDNTGQVSVWRQYKKNLSAFFGRNIIKAVNGGYYLTGTAQKLNGNIDIFLMYIDESGNEVWYKTYGEPAWQEYANSLILTKDSNILIMGSKSDDNTSPPYSYEFRKVLLLDQNGNIILDSVGNDENVSSTFDIASTEDGGYIFCGSYVSDRTAGHEREVGYIEKVDSNLHSVWQKKLGSAAPLSMTFINSINECANGDILASGYILNESIPVSQQHQNGWLIKLNSAGALIWSREYRGVTRIGQDIEENKLFDFGVLDDGGIIACGKAQDDNDTFPQKTWLLRIDKDGCLNDSFCGYTEIEENVGESLTSFEVYPNPFISKLFLKVVKSSMVEVNIMDVMGQNVYFNRLNLTEEKDIASFDLEYLPSGLYFLQLATSEGRTTKRLIKP
ncbi:MAG: T9SS type A sorting domain-containing protein [Chitinophagales bacterium]